MPRQGRFSGGGGVSLEALAAAQRLGPLLASLGDSPEVDQAVESVRPPLERTRFCVTGPAEAFAAGAAAWLGSRPAVRSVSLQSPTRAY